MIGQTNQTTVLYLYCQLIQGFLKSLLPTSYIGTRMKICFHLINLAYGTSFNLTCLLKNTDDWYSGLDISILVGIVFIDLKKAFDTVHDDILCQKLNYYSIQRELLWFQCYLSNWQQFCRENGIDSEINSINISIAQASCLGPSLFTIYINNLPQAVLNSNISMYADDTR